MKCGCPLEHDEMPCYNADETGAEGTLLCKDCIYNVPEAADCCQHCGEYPCKCDGDWAPAMDFYRPF